MVTVVASVVVAYASFFVLMVVLVMRCGVFERYVSRRLLVLAVWIAAAVSVTVGAYWIAGTYVTSHRQGNGFVSYVLYGGVGYSGLAFILDLVVALPLALFLAAIVALRAVRGETASIALPDIRWPAALVAFVFAAFVVGQAGTIEQLGIPLPIPFVAGFIAILVLTRRGVPQPAEPDLGTGPERDWWLNGLEAVRLGAPLAVLPFLFYCYLLLHSHLRARFAFAAVDGIPNLLVVITNEAVFWLAAALVLGWLLAYLPWSNCALKGLSLALIYTGAVALGKVVTGGITDQWGLRAFVLVLFYIGLGTRLDLATLHATNRGRDYLVTGYQLNRWRGLAGYAAPALLALIGIAHQIYVGDLAHAGENILNNLTTLIPSGPAGR